MNKNLDPRILDKIKKCLALSSSSNPNEAAIALRQAHALMEKHDISSAEIAMADIGESTVASRTMARDRPARWEARLAATVGKAFGCQMMIQTMVYKRKGAGPANDGYYVYVGLKQQVAIAAYTADVLLRKCKSARQKWIAGEFKGLDIAGVPGLKKRITRMGDAFAEGWVLTISDLVSDFAKPEPAIEKAIERHVKAQTGDAPEEEGANVRGFAYTDVGRNERIAAAAGKQAAEGETLYRPMNSKETPLALPTSEQGKASGQPRC